MLVQRNHIRRPILPMPHSAIGEFMPLNIQLAKHLFFLLLDSDDFFLCSGNFEIVHLLSHDHNKLRLAGLDFVLHAQFAAYCTRLQSALVSRNLC